MPNRLRKCSAVRVIRYDFHQLGGLTQRQHTAVSCIPATTHMIRLYTCCRQNVQQLIRQLIVCCFVGNMQKDDRSKVHILTLVALCKIFH